MRIALPLVASVLLLPALLWLRFDTRPAAALPQATPNAKRFAALSAFLGQRETVVLLSCGSSDDDARFVQQSAAWSFGELVHGASSADAAALAEQALALWPEDDMTGLEAVFRAVPERVHQLRAQAELPGGGALLRQAQSDPLGLSAALFARLQMRSPLTLGPDLRLRAGDCRVSFLFTRMPSSDRSFSRALAAAVQVMRAKVPGLHATGPHLYAAEYDARLSQGLWRSGLLSLAVVVLVCFVLFRDLLAMLLIGLTLALASGWTLGAATLVMGELQILAVSAASILPAVGIDAGIQFYVHRRMVRPIYVAALASGLGFATLAFAQTPAFRQFGLLLALGVAANTLAMATVLPALFAIAARLGWRPRTPRAGLVERAGVALGSVPKPVGWVLLALLLATLAGAYRPPPQRLGFSALSDPTLEAAKAQRVFEQAFGASDRHVFVVSEGQSEDEAIARQKRLRLHLDGVTVEGGPLLWITETDRERAMRWRASLDPPATAKRLRATLEAADFDADAFDVAMIEQLGTAAWRPPPLASLAYRQRVGRLGEHYWALTSLFVSPAVDGPATLAALQSAVGEGNFVVGPFALDLELGESLRADGRLLALLAVAAVLLALLAARTRLRSFLAVVSALVLLFACLWLSLGALQLPLTLVTLLVVPFVLGIGIDASVYLAEHDAFMHDRRRLLVEHLRPLLGSTLTTLGGFACLAFVDLEQIRLLGTCVTLGLGWALLIALVWIPTLAGPPGHGTSRSPRP